MANRKISQFATLAAGSQSSAMVLPIVDLTLGATDAANKKVALDSLFSDLGLDTADGATGMTGLLAAPSASAAGKLKWYYNNSTKQWLASIDTGAYYSVQRSIAAGLTAGWLPYVDTGGILNGSANATLDGNGSLFCKFVTIQSALAGLNSVAEINDSTGTDRWEIRLGASNQLIIQDFQNSKDVITLTPGATPVVQLNGTLRWLTDNAQDIGLVSSGRARTAYIGTSVIIGRPSNQSGILTFNNSTNTNQTSFQAGAAAASRTYTWPTDFGAAGSVLTDAAGNGTLSWAVPAGTIGGSIAANQVAYGSGANTITGTNNLTYDGVATFAMVATAGGSARIALSNTTTTNGIWYQVSNTGGLLYMGLSNSAGTNFGLTGETAYAAIFGNAAGNATQIAQGGAIVINVDNTKRISFGSGSMSTTAGAQFNQLSSTTIQLVLKQAAAATASAAQLQNSSSTVLLDINSGGMLTIGTAYSGLDRAIWLRAPGYDSSTTLYGIVNDSTFPSTATSAVYRYYSLIATQAAAFTVTAGYNYFAGQPNLGAGSAITTCYGFYVSKQKVTGVTTGYGVYQADSGDVNYFAGNVGIAIGPAATAALSINKSYTDMSVSNYGLQLYSNTTGAGGAAEQFAMQSLYYNSASGTTQTGTLYGGIFGIVHNCASDTSLAIGLRARLQNFSTGNITDGRGIDIFTPSFSSTGVIVTNTGLRVRNQGVAGITTSYGIHIEAQSASGTAYSLYSAGGINYLAGILRLQLTSTVGVLSMGGASQAGAYYSISTSSQVANDAMFSAAMVGSITGTLYCINASATATTGIQTKIVNTENATSTSHNYIWLATGGGSGGDPYVLFNISGVTNWSLGIRNSDSDSLYISAGSDLSTSPAIKITTANLVTFAAGVVFTGKQKNLTVSTGAGSALLGANSPAATLTAPFEWINVTLSDGSTGYIPAWK